MSSFANHRHTLLGTITMSALINSARVGARKASDRRDIRLRSVSLSSVPALLFPSCFARRSPLRGGIAKRSVWIKESPRQPWGCPTDPSPSFMEDVAVCAWNILLKSARQLHTRGRSSMRGRAMSEVLIEQKHRQRSVQHSRKERAEGGDCVSLGNNLLRDTIGPMGFICHVIRPPTFTDFTLPRKGKKVERKKSADLLSGASPRRGDASRSAVYCTVRVP